MSDPVLTEEELAVWVGALQAVFGSFMLVFGRRRRWEMSPFVTPLSAMWIVIGLLKMLEDLLPERILLAGSAVAWALVIAWMVQVWRVSRARRASLPDSSAPASG